jgi:hypothetical protein
MSVIALARQQAARDAGSYSDLVIARISLSSGGESGKSRLTRYLDRLRDNYEEGHDDDTSEAPTAPPPRVSAGSGGSRRPGPSGRPPADDRMAGSPMPLPHIPAPQPADGDNLQEALAAVERLRSRTDVVSLDMTASTGTTTDTGGGTLLDKLMVHIPSDALALYATGLAFLSQSSPGYRWALAGIIAAFAVGLAVGVYRREIRAAGASFSWPWSLTFTVLFAFTAYVCVIPASPFEQFSFYGPVFAGMVGVIANAVLALVAVWTEP